MAVKNGSLSRCEHWKKICKKKWVYQTLWETIFEVWKMLRIDSRRDVREKKITLSSRSKVMSERGGKIWFLGI